MTMRRPRAQGATEAPSCNPARSPQLPCRAAWTPSRPVPASQVHSSIAAGYRSLCTMLRKQLLKLLAPALPPPEGHLAQPTCPAALVCPRGHANHTNPYYLASTDALRVEGYTARDACMCGHDRTHTCCIMINRNT